MEKLTKESFLAGAKFYYPSNPKWTCFYTRLSLFCMECKEEKITRNVKEITDIGFTLLYFKNGKDNEENLLFSLFTTTPQSNEKTHKRKFFSKR